MLHVLNKKFSRSTFLIVGCVAFLLGLGFGRNISLPVELTVLAGVFAAISLPRKKFPALLFIAVFLLFLGVLRSSSYSDRLSIYQKSIGGPVVLSGTAMSDAVYGDGGQLEFDIGNVEFVEPEVSRPPGTIKIEGFGASSVNRGDTIVVRGNMSRTGGSRQGRIRYAAIEVIGRDTGALESFRKRFVAGVYSAVPDPEASFGLGLLIGQRSTLPDNVSNHLAIAGLTHIIAVSGYNLTIIVRMVRRALGGRSKYQSTVIAFTLIGLFILVTGFSASIVRAAVVSTLSLLAWYYGRTIRPIVLLLISAAITAGWNPIFIWSDIGWYLSFLAFFGVLILAPLLKQRLYGNKPQKLLGQVVLESVCAQIMAAPLILYIFGEVSLIALVSNALVVPMVPLAMLFSLIAGVAGMVVPVLSGFFAVPATLILTYILDIVALLSKVPGALLETHITLGNMLYIYTLLIVATAVLYAVLKRKYARIPARNIIE